MKILILSDLHLKATNDFDRIKDFTKEMLSRVSVKCEDNEKLVIITLGDIIDKGSAGDVKLKYAEAEKYYSFLREEVSNVTFYFVPGNHELEKNSEGEEFLGAFNEFTLKFNPVHFCFTKDDSIFNVKYESVNLMLVDSVLNRNHSAEGKIDIELLKDKLDNDNKNLIFMHYPPYETIKNDKGLETPDKLVETNSNYIFFGHQHGFPRKWDEFEKDTDIHAVGSLFAEGGNISYMLLDVLNGRIRYAYRYECVGSYHKPVLLFPLKENVSSHELELNKPDAPEGIAIDRKIHLIQQHNTSDLYSPFVSNNYLIQNVLNKERNVVIYGGAGTGKSYEMKKIYHSFYDNKDYFPIYIDLGKATVEYVKLCFNYANNYRIDRKVPILILDAFDELLDKETEIKREISTAISNNVELKIIISSRTYHLLNLRGFCEYKLISLSIEEIKTIAEKRKVDSNFFSALIYKGLLCFAEIPFYLMYFIEVYKTEGKLPDKEKLLDGMISYKFKDADKKLNFPSDNLLMDREFIVRNHLMEFSFILQALRLSNLINNDFTSVFNAFEINNLRRTGLIVNASTYSSYEWSFEHNIWREYLVAKYISELEFEQLLDVITFDDESKKIRHSWMQVIVYLLLLRKTDDLKSWLIENPLESIYLAENSLESTYIVKNDSLSKEELYRMFISILEYVAEKQLPLHVLCKDIEQFCDFFNEKDTLSYCLSVLKEQENHCSINSVLYIISGFHEFYGFEYPLANSLIELIHEDMPEYIVSKIGDLIFSIVGEPSEELADKMYRKVLQDKRATVVNTFCFLINSWKFTDIYNELIFDEIKDFAKYYENRNGYILFIFESLDCFNVTDNILNALTWICQERGARHYHKIDKIFDKLIEKIQSIIESEGKEIIIKLIPMYLISVRQLEYRKSKRILEVFDKYDFRGDVLRHLISNNSLSDEWLLPISRLLNEVTLDILCAEYSKGNVDNCFMKNLTAYMMSDYNVFEKLSTAFCEKTGETINYIPPKDWEKDRKESKQIIFNALFDKEKFQELIDKLFEYYDVNTKCGEVLNSSDIRIPYDNDLLHDLQMELCRFSDWDDCSLEECLLSPKWENFCIREIIEFLKDDDKEIIISECQKVYLQKYYLDKKSILSIPISELDYQKEFHIRNVIALIVIFDFSCEDELLLNMLNYPWYYFDNSRDCSQSLSLEFVEKHISNKDLIYEKIVDNIRNKKITDANIETYLIYCKNNKLSIAFDLAKNTFLESQADDSSTIWESAVEYLLFLKGQQYLDDIIGKQICDENIRYLLFKLQNVQECSNLISLLIERNKASINKTQYLRTLMRIKTDYALEIYVDLVKRHNKIPELLKKGEECLDSDITYEIGRLHDISILKYLKELVLISYSQGFEDIEDFGLKSSLWRVIETFSNTNPGEIKSILLELRNENTDNTTLVKMCNYHINNIEYDMSISSDTAWSKSKIRKFIIARRQAMELF